MPTEMETHTVTDIVTIGDATLYHGDCLEILPTLDKVDAAITDPPYSANTHKMAKTNKGKGHGVKLIGFSSMGDCEFIELCSAVLTVTDGWVVMTCDHKHAPLMFHDERFIRLGAWIKANPMPQISADRPGQGHEAVLILHGGKVKKSWNRGGGSAVWRFNVHNAAEVPTQKPLSLAESFVSDFTHAQELVLDPFMGSGTTGVACANLQRKFIGIEIERKYFDIACERIEAAYAQGRLFT